MGRRRTRMGIGLALCMAMVTGGAVMAADRAPEPPVEVVAIPAQDSGAQAADADGLALATNCRKTFTKNDGLRAFNWCYSDDGNITMIEHSAGLEHVANGTITEGFCVSAGHVKRGESPGASANFGLRNPHYPANNTVVHRTLDNVVRIEQKFSQNYVNRRITVQMNIRNRSDSPINNVYVTRYIDADLSNTTGGDVWSSAARSVAVVEGGSARLELIPRTVFFNANSMIFSSFLPSLDEDCYDAAADATLEESASDRSMGVFYQLGTIFPGESKTVKFDYRSSI